MTTTDRHDSEPAHVADVLPGALEDLDTKARAYRAVTGALTAIEDGDTDSASRILRAYLSETDR